MEAELAYAGRELARAQKLRQDAAISADELEARQQRVTSLQKQIESLSQQAAAMKRGPIPEEVAVAGTNCELRQVRAQSAGAILHLYRHTGDYLSANCPTPILRMADTNRLQVRVEVGEWDVYHLKPGMTGAFEGFGMTHEFGSLALRTILPSFAPKRLFDPDGNELQHNSPRSCFQTHRVPPHEPRITRMGADPSSGFIGGSWSQGVCIGQGRFP